MDNYQYGELKDAISRIRELESDVARLKHIVLKGSRTMHFSVSSEDEGWLYESLASDSDE